MRFTMLTADFHSESINFFIPFKVGTVGLKRASSHLMLFILYMHQAAALPTTEHEHLLRMHAFVANIMCFYTEVW